MVEAIPTLVSWILAVAENRQLSLQRRLLQFLDDSLEGTRSSLHVFLLLFAFAAVVSFWNLGGGSIKMWDEALGAERAREMLVTGDWLSPHFQFVPDFNKPPLYYWFSAAVFRVYGLGEFGARLPSVLFALACLGFAYRLAVDVSGSARAGLLCVFLLVTDPFWINQTREGLQDSGLLFAMLAAIYFLLRNDPRLVSALVAGLLLGLGCLIKSPVAFVALAAPLAQLVVARSSRHTLRPVVIAAATGIAVALPWYLFQYFRWGGDFLRFHFGMNMLERTLHPIQGHVGPPWFYLAAWVRYSPLTFALLVGAVVWSAARDRTVLTRTMPFLALTVILFVSMSLAGSKRETYLLFLLPFAAITSGILIHGLQACFPDAQWRPAVLLIGGVAALVLFFSRYNPDLEFSQPLKRVALEIRSDSLPGDLVWTIDTPVNVVLFYSRRSVGYAGFDDLPERTARIPIPEDRPVYFVVRTRDKERLLPLLVSMNYHPEMGTTLYEGKYTVLKMPGPSRLSSGRTGFDDD